MPWAGDRVAAAGPWRREAPIDFEFDPVVAVTGTTDYFVFAAATCDADRANIDPASGQPCATLGAPLVDLVANDNNLGLRVAHDLSPRYAHSALALARIRRQRRHGNPAAAERARTTRRPPGACLALLSLG